jgi:hypothetical protein
MSTEENNLLILAMVMIALRNNKMMTRCYATQYMLLEVSMFQVEYDVCR